MSKYFCPNKKSGDQLAARSMMDVEPSPEDFLTGFIGDLSKSEMYGRPVGIALLQYGSTLISDDVNNIIWWVTAARK
jgi:glucose/arabinose dehydrogenase